MRMKRISMLLASLVLAAGLIVAFGLLARTASAGDPAIAGAAGLSLARQLSVYGPAAPGSPAAPGDPVCDASLAAYWKLEETEVSDPPLYDDASPNNRNAGGCDPLMSECPTPIAGKVGGAQRFDRSEKDGIQWTNTSNYGWNVADDFSFEMWVDPGDCSSGSEVALGRSDGGDISNPSFWVGCKANLGNAYFELYSGSTDGLSLMGPVITGGSWHHLVAVWDATQGGAGAGTASLYVDGTLALSDAHDFGADFKSDEWITLGWYDGPVISTTQQTFPLNGGLDEVAIYNKALTLDEITKHYKNGTGRSYCNTPPSATTPTAQTGVEGQPPTLTQIVASDSDADTLSFSDVDSGTGQHTLPAGLTLNPNNGQISGTISYTDSTGAPTVHNVKITVADNGAPVGSTLLTFQWTVNNVNRKPVITDPGTQSNAEGQAPTLTQIVANDPDNTPTNSNLVFTITNLPKGLTYNPDTGQISGSIAYDAAKTAPYTVNISVADKYSPPAASDPVSFIWNVTDVNGKPALAALDNRTTPEGATISFSAAASDPDGDTLKYTAANLPPGISINANTGEISGTVDFTADAGSPYLVTVTVEDNGAPKQSDSKTFTWTIGGINRAPQATNPGNQTFLIGQTVSLQIVASDPDGDALTFSDPGHTLPTWLTLNTTTGLIYTPAPTTVPSESGKTYSVVITVTDSNGVSSASPVTFTIVVGKRQIFFPSVLRNLSIGN